MVDLISLRALVASPSSADRDVLRRGAALATVPIEMLEADAILNRFYGRRAMNTQML